MSGERDETARGRRERPTEGATADQLRSDIDSGRAQDKVPNSDPAAAPLGTDAEAAGNPPTVEEVELARQREVSGRASRAAAESRDTSATEDGAPRRIAFALLAIVVLGVVVVALAVW